MQLKKSCFRKCLVLLSRTSMTFGYATASGGMETVCKRNQVAWNGQLTACHILEIYKQKKPSKCTTEMVADLLRNLKKCSKRKQRIDFDGERPSQITIHEERCFGIYILLHLLPVLCPFLFNIGFPALSVFVYSRYFLSLLWLFWRGPPILFGHDLVAITTMVIWSDSIV